MPPALAALDHRFDAAFGAAANPLKHLGASAFLLMGLLGATGIVLFAVLDTSVAGAWQSIDALSAGRFSAGSILRGLHRYAADALLLVVALHLLRELLLGRFANDRALAWSTGVVLLPIALACAIGGFWLHWDRLGQFSAMATAEWLDALPILPSPFARNFLVGAVEDRLFTLLVFVHLGLPLLLLFGAWAHVQRLGHPDVFPSRSLTLGTLATLVVLAVALPVQGQGPAELGTLPRELAYDWFLLFVHPLAAATSNGAAWVWLGAPLAALLALPLIARRPRAPVARVQPADCSGCGRCVDDCPFGAITLVPHPDRRAGSALARVQASACAGCGICVGACPSSTPFRSAEPLVSGIEWPPLTTQTLRTQVREALAGGAHRIVFSCAGAARPAARASDAVVLLPCAAMLPPAFVEFALREGARQAVVAACREGGCAWRLGPQWTRARLAGQREPHLRALPAGSWQAHYADAGEPFGEAAP
ncbi:4Fe-4S dicluster domain-containing protein [Ramlibacter sp.]|uniref:4Fe-4S dicluster domain-containing protein n=1 Tax=Ramlibacter sp. TaxID=1917967 RepID=UPI0035B4EDC6